MQGAKSKVREHLCRAPKVQRIRGSGQRAGSHRGRDLFANPKETTEGTPIAAVPTEAEVTLRTVLVEIRNETAATELGNGTESDNQEFPLQFREGFTKNEQMLDFGWLPGPCRVILVFLHLLDGVVARDVMVRVEEVEFELFDTCSFDRETFGGDVAVDVVITASFDQGLERATTVDGEDDHFRHQYVELDQLAQLLAIRHDRGGIKDISQNAVEAGLKDVRITSFLLEQFEELDELA